MRELPVVLPDDPDNAFRRLFFLFEEADDDEVYDRFAGRSSRDDSARPFGQPATPLSFP
eukprot:CAMPEP_0114504476 /NCGR_PEP_ID=MMETSP0109-20121206/10244_1 /TAXON_ID=29199 /ORGANISM="Chlorarachnion reptans, Strain CCCM449" /LENGTH=58 /DNA_ID=CAMNT_0001682659 /DNA_START=173 /DNA_END=346 /DNA_ORIENTATION=-